MSGIQVRLNDPKQLAIAANEGRLLVRTPGNGVANFFIIGDELVATARPDQAAYFAGIEGYEVEGYEPVRRGRFGAVPNWFDEGDRLFEERRAGAAKQAETSTDPLSTLIAALGGPDALLKVLAERVAGSGPQVAEQAAREEAARQEAAARYEAERDWTLADTRLLDDQQLHELMLEFLPHVDTSTMSTLGEAAQIAALANGNTLLSSTLVSLLEDRSSKSRELMVRAATTAPRERISERAARKPAAKKPAAKPRTASKRR